MDINPLHFSTIQNYTHKSKGKHRKVKSLELLQHNYVCNIFQHFSHFERHQIIKTSNKYTKKCNLVMLENCSKNSYTDKTTGVISAIQNIK